MSWDEASEAARAAGVEVRRLTTLEEADDAIRIMAETWGAGHVIPRELLRALETAGNLVQGAYRDDVMIGFVLGFYGTEPGGFHLHSERLAVLAETRSAGVGYALKLAQCAAVLDEGATEIRWTFDPLVSRNAYLNLHKLGGVADRFDRDFYGQMAGVLDANDRSDRLWVGWDLRAERGALAAEGAVVVLDRTEEDRPVAGNAPVAGRPALIRIPREYQALRERDPASAREWREATAPALAACFAAGLVARDFSDSTYVFA